MHTVLPEYESNIIIIYFCVNKESSFKIDPSELVISCNKINIKIAIFWKVMSFILSDTYLWKLLLHLQDMFQ